MSQKRPLPPSPRTPLLASPQTPLLNRETPQPSPTKAHPLEWKTIAAIISGTIASFVAAADSTITSTLSSTIATQFQSFAIISWLGAGYLIGLAATQPLTGKLSDIFGRKASFIFATMIFTLGNLTCGFSGSRNMTILGRVIAGVGGGGCTSIATFISSDNIPPRYRGIWHSVSIMAYTGGMGVGAVAGGVINDMIGWRWAFIAIAPISICAAIGVGAFLPQEEIKEDTSLRKQLRRIDYGGSITLVSSLALFLFFLNGEGHKSVALLPLGVLFLAMFIMFELRVSEPIIPLPLLRTPTLLAAYLCTGFMSMTMYTLMYYVPLYLQLRGHSTSQTGFLLLFEPIGGAIGSTTVGVITSATGKYSIPKVVQPFLIVLGSAGFVTLSMTTSSVLPPIYQFVYGFGYGGFLTTVLLASLSAVPHELQARSTSTLLTFRSVGSTIGLSVAGILFRTRLTDQTAGQPEQTQLSYLQFRNLHSTDNQESPQNAFMNALHGTFQLALAFAISGFICALRIKNYKLRSTLEDNEDTVV
ncbi:unnamed protein product [Penicillium egyptiacum]|uniref:MFS-type drug efflux transporter P55 n=1 Tax=Penicillium egyptiacum TaxID=1303716 RepID=A0A9W4P4S1_9EURO|nr:unnamed protein product [Penicillium egyptiacum]